MQADTYTKKEHWSDFSKSTSSLRVIIKQINRLDLSSIHSCRGVLFLDRGSVDGGVPHCRLICFTLYRGWTFSPCSTQELSCSKLPTFAVLRTWDHEQRSGYFLAFFLKKQNHLTNRLLLCIWNKTVCVCCLVFSGDTDVQSSKSGLSLFSHEGYVCAKQNKINVSDLNQNLTLNCQLFHSIMGLKTRPVKY